MSTDDRDDAEVASLRARVAALEEEAARLRAEARVARAVIEETPLVIYAKGADQRFVLSNRRHASLIGLSMQAILGRTDRDLFGSDAADIDRVSARVLETGEPAASEFTLSLEDQAHTFHETIFRLLDDEGRVLGLGGIATDITARKAAEAHARMLSLALEQSHEAVVLTDLTGRIEFVNESFVQRTGYSREELMGQNPRILQSGKTPRENFAAMWASLRRGETWKGEFVNRRRDGSEFTEVAAVSPVRQESGQVTHYLAIKQDVTELKRMGAELERHRAHLEDLVRQRTDEMKAIFRALPDLYFRVDLRGVVLDFISGVERDLVAPPSAFLGRPVQDVLPEPLRALFVDALERVKAGEAIVTYEYDLTIRDEESSYEARVLRLDLDHAVVVVRNITDRRNAEKALAAARDAAEAASRVKTDFLARMSHEIRTPLASVVGYADLLLHGAASGEALAHAGHIRRNAEHLLGLVDDILDVSRIETDKLTFTQEPLSPAAALADVATLLRPLAVERGLTLHIELDPSVPRRITTDPLRFQQVLVNLVNNALKFTDRGKVTVRARVDVDASTDARWLVVAVQDTGIGIERALIPKLFIPFMQLHGRGVARGRGTGLGLSISARLAAGLRGRLDVESEVGVGSTFTLRVPVTADESRQRLDADRSQSSAPRGGLEPLPNAPHVLVVDDNPDLYLLLERVLIKLGARVRVAVNGQEAVDRVAEADASGRPFDVVLMDMQMPVLDGYEAVRALRARGSKVPVVALTAFAMAGDAERCLAAGCDAYLPKPINFPRLRQLLAELLSHPSARR